MQNSEIEETQPTASQDIELLSSPRAPWVWWIIIGWVLLLAVAALGAYVGYQEGIEERLMLRATEDVEAIEAQYQLGLQDFQAEDYDRARQRFEYVIEQNPNHDRAIEMLARALSIIQATATPTPVTPTATPSLTPTPDLRGDKELFNQAQEHLADGQWDASIDALLSLRKLDPNFQAIQVDSMLYISLRNRGVEKILNQGELEGGIYDFSQAELFGPLDVEVQNYRNWARLYIFGASFWQVDWEQAAFYFGQVALVAPNLHDSSNWAAIERYRTALQNYIDFLVEIRDWCQADAQMEILRSLDANLDLEPTQNWLQNKCAPSTATHAPTDVPTPTAELPPSPTGLTPPTEGPTPTVGAPPVEPTASATPNASATPTP